MSDQEPFVTTVEAAPDDSLLQQIAEWNVARAEAVLVWAQGDRVTLYQTRLVDEPDAFAHINHLREAERRIMDMAPETLHGVQRLIEMALTILRGREDDPESVLAEASVPALLRKAAAGVVKVEADAYSAKLRASGLCNEPA